jgi:hypothetical protein
VAVKGLSPSAAMNSVNFALDCRPRFGLGVVKRRKWFFEIYFNGKNAQVTHVSSDRKVS